MRTKDNAPHHAHEKGCRMSAPNDQHTTQTFPPEQPPTPPGQQPSSPETAPPPAPTQPASPTAPGSPPEAPPTAPRQGSPLSFVQGFLTAILLLGLIAAALYFLGLGQFILPETRRDRDRDHDRDYAAKHAHAGADRDANRARHLPGRAHRLGERHGLEPRSRLRLQA